MVRQKACLCGLGDTQEKSAVRESLIRWKTVRFSIEDRVIAHSVFASDHSDFAKLGKTFNHAITALGKFLCQRFIHVQSFGSSLILMNEMRPIYQQV